MLFNLTVTKQSLSAAKWINSIDDVASNPDIFSNGIRLLGNYFDNNFRDEGQTIGSKWQALSAQTRKVREERGYDGAHPILQQSGRLRAMAAGRFRDWRPLSFRGYMMSDADQGYENDGPTTMSANIMNMKFTATMTGPKVAHMIGATNAEADYFAGFSGSGRHGFGFMPARPFWNLDQEVVGVMSDAILDRIMLDWQSKDRKNTRRDSYHRAVYGDSGTQRRQR